MQGGVPPFDTALVSDVYTLKCGKKTAPVI